MCQTPGCLVRSTETIFRPSLDGEESKVVCLDCADELLGLFGWRVHIDLAQPDCRSSPERAWGRG